MQIHRLLVLGFLLGAPILSAAPLPSIEPMPTLEAALLAPAELLKGSDYTIDPKVPVVGYLGQFTLRASAGTFPADGSEMLAIRVRELAAIAQLSQMSRSGVFADALAASAMRTGNAIGQAVMNPVTTVAGIPAGLGRLFQSATTTFSRATETGAGVPSPSGVNRALRRIAREVGADPYTTNPVLAKQLNDLAVAAFSGGISLDVALAVTTAGVGTAISATATVSNLVWEKSPEDIRSLNEQRLTEMGVASDTIRTFVTNRWLTPTLSVPFVEHLAQMKSAKGRAAVVALAANVGSETEARYMLNVVSMAKQVGTDQDPVVTLELAGRIVVIRTRSGRMVVPAPIDYVVWTEPVKAFAQKKNLKVGERRILVTGLASTRAREGLQATGWSLQERSKR